MQMEALLQKSLLWQRGIWGHAASQWSDACTYYFGQQVPCCSPPLPLCHVRASDKGQARFL